MADTATTEQTEAQKDVASQAVRLFKHALKERRGAEYEWFLSDNALAGSRAMIYNRLTKRLEAGGKELSRITVNKNKQLVRGIVSRLNKNHPGVTIQAGIGADDAYSRAKKIQYLCDDWYDNLQMNAKNKRVSGSGVRYGIAVGKVYWDTSRTYRTLPYTKGKQTRNTLPGNVQYAACNTKDVYWDLEASSKEDMRYVVHAVPRTIGEINKNPRYNKVTLTPDDKISASDIFNHTTHNPPGVDQMDEDLRTIIVLECFIKELQSDGTQKIKQTVATLTGDLLYDDYWMLDEFPFEFYQTEVTDKLIESVGSLYDVRNLAQALSRGASQAEESLQKMGKLHWLMPKGAGVTVIDDRTGSFIEYNPAAGPPTQARNGELPVYHGQHMANLERWFDDIGGAHDATYGRLPTSRASGDAIQSLQQGDASNFTTMQDNFDDYLARVFKLMLKTGKAGFKAGVLIPVKGNDYAGQYDFVELKPEDIYYEDTIKVHSGSNMPDSEAERQALAMEMWDKGIIKDPAQILRMMGFEDVEYLVGDDQMDVDRQLQEVNNMRDGKKINDPVISENHDVHIKVLDGFVKSPGWFKLKKDAQNIIMAHRALHVRMSIQLAMLTQTLNVDAMKRSVNFNVQSRSMDEYTPIERAGLFTQFGVNSDSAEIQMRGGLKVEDPMEALKQANMENQLFIQNEAPKVSLTDDHKIHLETHGTLQGSADFKTMLPTSQQYLVQHIAQHMKAMAALTPQPGLIANADSPIPIPDHSVVTASDKNKKNLVANGPKIPGQQ